MSRDAAIRLSETYFDSGGFKADLARRVAIPTASQNPDRADELKRYLDAEMVPALEALGFRCRLLTHAKARGPFLAAERIEAAHLPTVLCYGHGDVIRGLEAGWAKGLSPFVLTEKDGRYYGRGVADNKGQHTIGIAAMGAVIAARGRLGFNAKWLIEMGEETGSAGLREVCAEHRALFAADALIGSDGPRLSIEQPTIYLGNRGAYPVDLWIEAREGGHHSGNWGGLLSNPAIELAHAIAAIVGPQGQIRVPQWVPDGIPDSVKRALADCEVHSGQGSLAIDPGWGEPGLTSAEKLYAWSTFEILAMSAGNPEAPVNAVPPHGLGARPAALRGGGRSGKNPAGAAAPPRSPRLYDGADRQGAGRDFSRHPPRPGSSVGAMGGGLDRAHRGPKACDPAEHRRSSAQRRVRGAARPADDLGAAFLSGLLAARAQRAPAARARARGLAAHGRALLGSRRGRHAGAANIIS